MYINSFVRHILFLSFSLTNLIFGQFKVISCLCCGPAATFFYYNPNFTFTDLPRGTCILLTSCYFLLLSLALTKIYMNKERPSILRDAVHFILFDNDMMIWEFFYFLFFALVIKKSTRPGRHDDPCGLK